MSELPTPPAVMSVLKYRPQSLFPDATVSAVALVVGAAMAPGTCCHELVINARSESGLSKLPSLRRPILS